MPEDFLTKREFDGFAVSIRDVLKGANEQWATAHAKLDTLLSMRVEEAMRMGQLTEAVRAIGERQRQQEQSIESLRRDHEQNIEGVKRAQEEQNIRIREEFNTLWDNEQAKNKDSLKWWWRAALYALVAFMGAFINKFFTLIKR